MGKGFDTTDHLSRMRAMLTILLRDNNDAVAEAWQEHFAGCTDVEIGCGDIFERRADAIISPANSFGYMDGGIDLVYSRVLGRHLEGELQALLRERHFGELPVGQAVILPTGHAAIPFLVSAPTMRVPTGISRTVNVYLAFRAALIAVVRHNEASERPIASVLVPGLGTGVGDMPPDRSARQMRRAYDAVVGGAGARPRNAGAIWGEHSDLLY
jgi:O-acetyl-ADP-ribose deacetylase (regulator of RNase III)